MARIFNGRGACMLRIETNHNVQLNVVFLLILGNHFYPFSGYEDLQSSICKLVQILAKF